MLDKMLVDLAKKYTYERGKPFVNSDFGNFIRHDLAIEAKKHLIFLPFDLSVKASVGAGNWAAVPWLGFFDPLITKSATQGFYVVYLINAQTAEIILSLNQGTTAVFQEFGDTRGLDVLKRRAIDMKERVSDYASNFDESEIDLGSVDRLPKGYCAGHSFGRRYHADNMNVDLFYSDLENMLSAYQALIDRGGQTPSDTMQAEAETSDIIEARRYILSKRIERAPNVRPKVLEKRKHVCEGCGLDPALHLGFSGSLKNLPLDVHHVVPMRQLAEGESRRYRIPSDFFVLCPTCHRMIHQQLDVGDLEQLKSKINFFRVLNSG